MKIRHKVGTIAGSMAVLLAAIPGISDSAANASTESFNQKTAAYIETFIGRVRYEYGGSSPRTGFDCSGLTQYVYRHYGKSIPRTADDQFLHFRRESRGRAWGGDLVFFHENSNPNSYVYHVGIYEGSNDMVSAADASEGIVWQAIWSSDVTFGTITH
jgi:cell wall-associated NlpC family hydrolase